MDIKVIEDKLAKLRLRYKNEPEKRDVIKVQARLLEIAKEIAMKKQQKFI